MKQHAMEFWKALNKRAIFMVSLILAIWVVFNVLSGGYILRAENLANLFRQTAVVAVLTTGITLVIVSGNIDLSVGSALGMFGALCAALITQLGCNSYAAVALVLIFGALIGMMHGALIHYLNIPSFVVTLGGLIAYRGVTQYVARESIPVRTGWIKWVAHDTIPYWLSVAIVAAALAVMLAAMVRSRAGQRRSGLPVSALWIDLVKLLLVVAVMCVITAVLLSSDGVPVELAVLLAITLATGLAARFTRFGRYVYAIGGNRQAALYSGVSIGRNTIGVFALMGVLSAIAGVLTVGELNSAAPDIGNLKELEAIAAAVIGGTSLMGGSGSVGMSVFGALVMSSIKNGMSMMGIVAQMQKVILGSLLVLAVALDQWSRRSRRR